MGDLQRLADSVGRSVDRAVAIHDRHGTLLAYSSQSGVIDEVRTRSILRRHTQDDAIAWSRSLGIESAAGPVRVPANEEMGMLARVCVPVRFDGKLLGMLWLIDPEGSLPNEALGTLAAAADTAGLAIHRDQMVRDIDRRHERELLRSLLVSDAPDHLLAGELVERNILTAGPEAIVVVVRPERDGRSVAAGDGAVRIHLEQATEEIRAASEPGQTAVLVRHDHAVLAFAGEHDRLEKLAVRAGENLAGEPEHSDHWDGWELRVGVGGVVADLAELARSYSEAQAAAAVATSVGGTGPVALWADLGVYRTLLAFPAEVDKQWLHPGLAALLSQPEAETWLRTLEEWLDQGGCAPSTAAALGVKRGTVYYRLRRIEEMTGADLQRGDDRLALHLGLKLTRLGRVRL